MATVNSFKIETARKHLTNSYSIMNQAKQELRSFGSSNAGNSISLKNQINKISRLAYDLKKYARQDAMCKRWDYVMQIGDAKRFIANGTRTLLQNSRSKIAAGSLGGTFASIVSIGSLDIGAIAASGSATLVGGAVVACVAAGAIGYGIGSIIESKFDLADKISDYLVREYGDKFVV